MTDEIKSLIRPKIHPRCYELCLTVLDDEQFKNSPGGVYHHHKEDGGLAQHTFEVVSLCISLSKNKSLKRVDKDILLVAAVFHDYAKIYDYIKDDDGDWIQSEYRDLVRNLSGSHAKFVMESSKAGMCPDCDWSIKVQHCILSHHGRNEWGSPVEPKSLEASILHYSDMLSSGYGVGS